MNQIDRIARTLLPQPIPNGTEMRDEWLDVLALVRIVRRRIGLIAIVIIIVMAGTIPVLMNLKPVFSAESRVLIKDAQIPDFMSTNLVREAQLNQATEAERLLSHDIAARVIQDVGLAQKEEFNPALRLETSGQYVRRLITNLLPGSIDGEAAADQNDPIYHIMPEYLRHLSIVRSSGSEVFSIKFSSTDPVLAAAVPNALIRIYFEERENLFKKRMTAAKAWLEKRVVDQRLVIEKELDAVREFRQTSVLGSSESLGVAQSIATLSEQRAEIAQKQAELSAKLTAFQAAAGSGLQADAIDTETMRGLGRERRTRQNELERLLKIYGNGNVDVVTLKAKIADIDNAIGDEIVRYRNGLNGQLETLANENLSVSESLKLTQTPLSRINDAEAELARLQREAALAQAGLDELEQQGRKLESEIELPVAEVEVLSPASVPLAADGRGRAFYALGALVAAGALAVSVALLREMMDRTVRSQEHLKPVAGVMPVGMVPQLPRRALRRMRGKLSNAPSPILSDAIRGLILAMRRSNGGRMPGSLLVTSALSREGKTTVATAIACELARSGHQVVLVDCNGRSGRLHTVFETKAEPGLNDYLSGQSSLSQVTRVDEISGVHLIARGSSNTLRRIDPTLMKAMIQSAKATGQIIVFDGNSALASTEMSVLSEFVEHVLLVVRWGCTNRRVAEVAVERLLRDEDETVSVAINRVNLRRQALYGFKDGGIFAKALRKQYSTFR